MPIDPRLTEFPRMLFKGEDSCVVATADQKAAKLAEGWVVRLLPGESEDEYPPVLPEPRRRGRPPAGE